MHITVISPVYLPYMAGMARVAKHYVDVAKKYDFEVDVITPATLKCILRYGNAASIHSFEKIINPATNLVHIHTPFIGAIGALLQFAKKNPHIPILTTYHMDLLGHGLKGLFFSYYNHFSLPKLLQISAKVQVTSLDYFNSSLARPHIQDEKIVEIPLGVDTGFFKSMGEKNKNPVILFVGALDNAHAFKGVPLLIQACASARKQNHEIHLLIVGEGNLKHAYETLAIKAGIADVTHFAGFVPDEKLPEYYSSCLCTVLPSIAKSEAFGLVLLESQSCGTPVIASDLPGVRTVVSSHSGILVEPGSVVSLSNAILAMLGRNAETHAWNELRNATRAFIVQNFDKKILNARILELYHTLISDEQKSEI